MAGHSFITFEIWALAGWKSVCVGGLYTAPKERDLDVRTNEIWELVWRPAVVSRS
jgi:hypothetical protein